MPRTLGDSFIHVSKLTYVVETDRPVLELPRPTFTDVHRRIGTHIAELIEDGATLQLGIGAIPDAVLSHLEDKRHLGIHTEMFSDGVMELFEAGVITNEKKTLHPGKIVTSFVMGSRELYDFVDNNPVVEMHPCQLHQRPLHHRPERQHGLDQLGHQRRSDRPGQLRQHGHHASTRASAARSTSCAAPRAPRAARRSSPFPSTAKGGEISRIVPTLSPGAGVVTSRGDVHYVVTEYGVAHLHGKTHPRAGPGADQHRPPQVPRRAGALRLREELHPRQGLVLAVR